MLYMRSLGDAAMFFRHTRFVYPGVWLSLAAVVVAVVIIVALIVSGKNKKKAQPDAAAEALKLRYIKGELTEEEYTKMKEVLGQ